MASDNSDVLLPWVEKYRPKKVEEVAHQEEVTAALQSAVESSNHNLPHLLFYGPPGTGKTSLILALAKDLFGPQEAGLFKERILEMNASDERGINSIREKVKKFAQTLVGNKTVPGYPCPPFKIIILDEADSMTSEAQACLRRVMENYSKVTRFVLICNYVTRIIEPLASRCSKFRFQPIAEAAHKRKLDEICAAEKVAVEPGALECLMEVAEGDLRRSITLLQSTSLLHEKHVTADALREVAGVAPPDLCEALLRLLKDRGKTITDVVAHVEALELDGYGAQIIPQLLDAISSSPDIPDVKKAKCALVLGIADARLADGVEEDLQLRWACSEMAITLQAA
jgi:replication factor C subunit 2/4